MALTVHRQENLIWLGAPQLELCPAVRHGFSTRTGGVSKPPFDTLNLGTNRGDAPDCVRENYQRFCRALGVDSSSIVMARQVHSTAVRICTAADAGKGLCRERDYTADALVSNTAGLALTVFSADCGTVLLYDPVQQAIGAVHAGWRGCAAGIVEHTVQTMRKTYGSAPEDLIAALGPCIGQECFETDDDVPEAMRAGLGSDAEPYLERNKNKWQVDLMGLNRQWLLRAGVRPERIDVCQWCTACRPDWFWSARRTGNARGAQVAMIALTESA